MNPRILVPLASSTSGPLRIEGAPLHHLRVLRVGVSDRLEVFDGRGHAWDAEVVAVEADHVLVSLGEVRIAPAGRAISIVQALPKADKLELVLMKGTELGAHAFHPVSSERSLIRLSGTAAEARRVRWQRIVAEAARQCGRLDVPVVHPTLPLLEAVAELPPGTAVLVLDEEERAVRLVAAAPVEAGAPLGLVIGPEGGLARSEVDGLRGLGAIAVSLGPLVLRTETAALAAVAVLRHRDGLLG
jgi:16S rRNA (uracil1498-N3)-methyltransferase